MVDVNGMITSQLNNQPPSHALELLLGAAELGELAAARELVISGLRHGHLVRVRVRVRVRF